MCTLPDATVAALSVQQMEEFFFLEKTSLSFNEVLKVERSAFKPISRETYHINVCWLNHTNVWPNSTSEINNKY